MASTPQTIEIGCIVRSKAGYDGVVLDKIALEDGHHAFDIFLIDSGETLRLNHRQLELVDTLDVPMSIEVDAPVAATDPAPESSASLVPSTVSTDRFATFENEEEIDRLADSRLSKNTKRQTDWALRVLRGEFIYLYLA